MGHGYGPIYLPFRRSILGKEPGNEVSTSLLSVGTGTTTTGCGYRPFLVTCHEEETVNVGYLGNFVSY